MRGPRNFRKDHNFGMSDNQKARMQVRGPQKLYCKHLVGDDRKSRAKAGRRLQAKLSCTDPARKSVKYHHICARTKLKTAVRSNPNAFERPTKIWANYLFGERRQSKARAGEPWLSKRTCIRPAQEQSSKLRSGATRMLLRGQRKFGPITSSVRGDSRKREPASPGCPNALVSDLRKNKAQNCGPEHSCVESSRSKDSRQAPFRRKLDVPKRITAARLIVNSHK